MYRRRLGKTLGTFAAAAAMVAIPMSAAQAYNPTGGILYQLGNEPCLKGRGNCAVYAKSAQLPGGRLVASFEKATVVPATGSADAETLPIYKSDDYGSTWQPLSEVKAPAYLSRDPATRSTRATGGHRTFTRFRRTSETSGRARCSSPAS